MVWIKVKKLDDRAVMPKYAKEGDAGFDLYVLEDTTIPAKTTMPVKTGLAMEIPSGYELQIRPRSGNSINGVKCYLPILDMESMEYVRVILGTVDSGYRGEIGIITENNFPYPIQIKAGTKLAQGVINAVPKGIFLEANELSSSDRGVGGFGSTGGHINDSK